ncbi:MAG: DUF3458 domain-containing protein, partial [Proteobacteria bacterium]|nr:DUF3458 domain-containing protein [Pseudomonadota bacterium]
RDLSQFKLWYTQAGTPRLSAAWSMAEGQMHLTLRQEVPATPGQPHKSPMVIPVALGLLDQTGAEILPETLVVLDQAEVVIPFDLAALAAEAGRPLPEAVIPSLLRGFSAPVILDAPVSRADRLVLLAHDTDPFNRWEAGRSLMRETLLGMLLGGAADQALFAAMGRLLADDSLDPAFRALVLALPSEDDIAQAAQEAGIVPDPVMIHATRRDLQIAMGVALGPVLTQLYDALDPGPSYRPDAVQAAQRALRNAALHLLTLSEGPTRAQAHYDAANNMTDEIAAFTALLDIGDSDVAGRFHDRWKDDRLVMDKWFMAQISHAAPGDAVALARRLSAHPLFDWTNPNRFRAVIGGLTAGNPAGFHDPSGAGYGFVADWLIRLDARNPQTAARMSSAFETWRRYDADRQAMILAALDRIAAQPGLSRDLAEMVGRMRAA